MIVEHGLRLGLGLVDDLAVEDDNLVEGDPLLVLGGSGARGDRDGLVQRGIDLVGDVRQDRVVDIWDLILLLVQQGDGAPYAAGA